MKRILIFLVAVILSLEILKIYLQGQLSEDGVNINTVNIQIGKLQVINSGLRVKLLQLQSYNTIHKEAIKDGFTPASYIYFK